MRVKQFLFRLSFHRKITENSFLIMNFSVIFSIIVPTFDTKVTGYLCSGWVFFLLTNFDFLTSHFLRNFLISFESYCCLELKLENIFHL